MDKRVSKILVALRKHYPESRTALHYSNPLEILVATILSAQCTDERVNKVTASLFTKYRKAKDYAYADIKTLEQDIRSTGFYKNKAKNIKNACKIISGKFGSKVPDTMEKLLTLPGIGRKTANVILGHAFDKVEGFVVDTHVRRVSYRLGLTKEKNPEKIEKDLMKLISKKDWFWLSFGFILHGRRICKAPTPFCSRCFLNDLCPKVGVTKWK